jgi:TonB family protein
MLRELCAAVAMAVVAHGAQPPGPSEFYIVSDSFTDSGPRFFYRVLAVTQDGADSVIRYVRIAPVSPYCGARLMVQAAQARVQGKSPADLAGTNNPCAVKPGSLRAAVRQYHHRVGIFETVSFGIVAECGASTVSLELPRPENVDLERMKLSRPAIARLWDLRFEIANYVFGPKDILRDVSEEDFLAVQRAAEKLLPELISGRYDRGLAAAAKEMGMLKWRNPTFRSLLEGYRGPIPWNEAQSGAVRLLNATNYRFASFVDPKYPPLALSARIQGKVELRLAVTAATGEVRIVSVIFGHPLLTPSAEAAAKQWRFEPNTVASRTVNVTLEYVILCGLPVMP